MARKNAPNNALVVRTSSYPTSAGGSGPDDPGVRPLAGCAVTVTVGPAPRPTQQVTGADGEVRFENLPAADYQISVAPPPLTGSTTPAFTIPPNPLFLNGGGPSPLATNLPVKDGGEVIVDVVITPKDGQVAGRVQLITPTGVVRQRDIQIDARNGGLLVDSDLTTNTGRYKLKIDRPGLIEIIPQSEVTSGILTFNPQPGDASQFVLVQSGDMTVVADIAYEASGAELLVGAELVEEVDGQEKRSTLDGVTFRLFEQGKADPVKELITQQQTPGAFSDLKAGAYRIEPLPPAASNGQRLQLTRPSTPALSIKLGDGQHIDLTKEFEFQPTRGSVVGSVVVARDDRPVPGVAIVLSSQQEPQLVRRTITDTDGAYEVDELPPGRYRVTLEQAAVTAFGTRFELEGDGDPGRTVEVRPRATSVVAEFRLIEDEHLITGQVLRPDGTGAAFVTVQIFSDPASTTPVDNVLTDQNGFYRFRALSAGTFFFEVLAPGGFAPQRMPVSVNSPTTAPPLHLPTGPPGVSSGAGTGGTGATSQPSNVQDLNDFPFLTEEVDLGGRGAPAQPGGGAGAVGQTVERALREVLGWRPRASDPKGFQAALLQAFTAEEVAGHTEYHWNPRSYAVEIQADLGAVTGAQASLYARAKSAVDQVLPLLEGLEALRVDFDPENVAAIRAIVRSQLTELVKELGIEGGPRVQRVDQLFQFLLGDTIAAADPRARRDPDQVGGSLGIFRDRFGLQRFRINEIKEEEIFSNFLIVIDHVVSLAESWDAQREFFVRGSTLVEPFLGTQLVLLSRDLEVIAESVHEVEFAMDSVFLGPSERQTLELRFPPGSASAALGTGGTVARSPSPMFVSELLSWVERFATEEGRQLIDEGGKQGVAVAFLPTIQLLQALVHDARVLPAGAQDPARMPDAYRRTRVQRALAELESQLAAAAARVEQIRAPNGPVTPPTPPVSTPPAPRRPNQAPPLRRRPVPDRDDSAGGGGNEVE
jgi:hypothetical protein